MKKRPKVQHYVTSSYLKGFTTGAGRRAMLYVHERNRVKPFRQKPKKAARQSNYYSFMKPDGTVEDGVEQLLGLVESEAIPILRKIASNNVQLNWDDRERLALFIAFQELRVPWARQNLEQVYASLVDHVGKFRANIPGLLERDLQELEDRGDSINGVTADSIREFLQKGEYQVEVDSAVSLLTMLQMAPFLHAIYSEMKWVVVRITGNAFFHTSDNPVIKLDPDHRGGFYGIGLASPTIEIRFPLDKNACLVIMQDAARQEKWHELMTSGKTTEASQLRSTIPNIEYQRVNSAAVDVMNSVTIEYATRFVYSMRRDPLISKLLHGEAKALKFQTSAAFPP